MTEAWARSGAMWLTGRPDGPPLDVPGEPADRIEQALTELFASDSTDAVCASGMPDVRLLGERAALLGLRRAGTSTAGGAGRLLPCADGWVALSLARHSDRDLIPALTSTSTTDDPWRDVARWAQRRTREAVVERTQLLGLPAAAVSDTAQPPRRPGVEVIAGGAAQEPRRRPRVLDLSALWAGPLCAHLLGLRGADVVKLESIHRPDGARRGDPQFYDLLHAGHRAVALDLHTVDGVAALRRLITAADLVIEGSRPRALKQLGIDAQDAVAAGTGWLSITAYGRTGDQAQRVGFGDDVAAGAGLVGRDQDGPVFAGDALADPLTGVLAAQAAVAALGSGEAMLLDVSMHDIARAAANAAQSPATEPAALPELPTARRPKGAAPRLGAHTREVLTEWGATARLRPAEEPARPVRLPVRRRRTP